MFGEDVEGSTSGTQTRREKPGCGRYGESYILALSDESYGLVKTNGKRLRAPFWSPPKCLSDPFESIGAS